MIIFEPGQVIKADDINKNFRALSDSMGSTTSLAVDCSEIPNNDPSQVINSLYPQDPVWVSLTGDCYSDLLSSPNGKSIDIAIEEGASFSAGFLSVSHNSNMRIFVRGSLKLREAFVFRSSGLYVNTSGNGQVVFLGSDVSFPIYGFIKSAIQIDVQGCAELKRGLSAYAGGGSRVEVNYRGDMSGCFDNARAHFADTLSYMRVGDYQGSVDANMFARENGVVSLINRSDSNNSSPKSVHIESGAHAELINYCGALSAFDSTARVQLSGGCEAGELHLRNSSVRGAGPLREISYDKFSSLNDLEGVFDVSNAAFTAAESEGRLPVDP